MIKLLTFIGLLFSFATYSLAQDCGSPVLLCSGSPQGGMLDTNAPVAVGCFNQTYTSFFTFTTNTNNLNTGNVTVELFGFECEDTVATTASAIQAIVVEVATGTDPCQPVNYIPVSDCATSTDAIVLETDDLNPSSSYVVIVGSEQDPANGDCMFSIEISGPAVEINACCDQQITLGQQAPIEVSGGNAIPGYSWEPSITLDSSIGETVVATPFETTEYTVTGEVGPCQGLTDLVTIIVGPPLGIPNTITPNGDGINDLWRIAGISFFPNVQVTIFDRWGQVVFRDIGYAQPWNGTNRGKALPTATYYYVIEVNSDVIEIEPVTGQITLIH